MQEFKAVLDRLMETQVALISARVERDATYVELDKLRQSSGGYVPSSFDVCAMLQAMAAGKKIEAIRLCRNLTGYGLKEAKDLIEAATAPYRAAA